jgi:hypothetical protein
VTRAEIRTVVKDLITHNVSGIDASVNTAISTAVEFITHNVSAIYDEDVWTHEFVQADIDNNYDNWQLPSRTMYVRAAAYRDVSGTEDTYTPLLIVSPDDRYNYNDVDGGHRPGFVHTGGEDFSGPITFGAFTNYATGLSRVGRSDQTGKPRLCYRLRNHIFIHPRPSEQELGNYLELFLAKYCDLLLNDGDTNTIAENYPYCLIHYAVGIMWATKLNNLQRAQASIQLAASMLQSVATKQEVSKLINLRLILGGA